MKYVSFTHEKKHKFGIIKDKTIYDLTTHFENYRQGLEWVPNLKRAIMQDKISEFNKLDFSELPSINYDDVELSPVIPNPGKILCVGLNYENHRAETKRPDSKYPTIFTRFPESQVGHDQAMICPKSSERFDYEGEMAIIIGMDGRYISKDDSMNHVIGYSCYNDGSVRDWQRHTSQFTPGKNFNKTGGFGPFMLTADEVDDYKEFKIQTRLNGQVMQDASLADLIFSIPEIIEYCSGFTELKAGDVIVTGTPGGVGDRREPPVYMTDGDIAEVEISNLGILKNHIIKEN